MYRAAKKYEELMEVIEDYEGGKNVQLSNCIFNGSPGINTNYEGSRGHSKGYGMA